MGLDPGDGGDHLHLRVSPVLRRTSPAIRDYPTWRRLVHPDEIERVKAERDAAIARDEPFGLEYRVVTPSGAVRWVSVVGRGITDVRGRLLHGIGMNLDVTERRENEVERERFTKELQRSNEELQRFAYVASHDLLEPLRSIVSFSQLLERRYRGRLDADADDYIAFIVDGGMRMQSLLQDLLQLSQVETTAAPLVPTDSNTVVADALRMLEMPIREDGATVEVGALPTVMADAARLGQVFSNLVGN